MKADIEQLAILNSWIVKETTKKPITPIFIGDFNMKLYYEEATKNHFSDIVKLIKQISPKEEFIPLLIEEGSGTMASWKKKCINDNFLVPKSLAEDSIAGVLAPLEFYPLSGTDHSLCRDKDVDRLMIPLITDHWPVLCHIK